jgi:hypothetical protein
MKIRNKLIIRSGNFAIKINNSDILEASGNSHKKVKVRPLKEGYVKVIVEDIQSTPHSRAEAIVIISDIDRIQLEGGGLLEQDSYMRLKLNVFGSSAEQFSIDQLAFMDLSVNLLEYTKSQGLKIFTESEISVSERPPYQDDNISNDLNLYLAKGIHVGTYKVSCSGVKKKDTIPKRMDMSGNQIKISVFSKLIVRPESILLLPGGRYTIKIIGGPLLEAGQMTKKFLMKDTKIASVSSSGEITGHRIGKTTLSIQMHEVEEKSRGWTSRSAEAICKKTIPIEVALLTSIEIEKLDSLSLLRESKIRLMAGLKHENNTFTYGLHPINYIWTPRNYNIFTIEWPLFARQLHNRKPSSQQSESSTYRDIAPLSGNYIAVNGYAYKPGSAQLTLAVTVSYPDPYQKQRSTFENTVHFTVSDDLYYDIQKFVGYQPHPNAYTYVIPPNSVNRLSSNKEGKLVIFKLKLAFLCFFLEF